MPVFVLTAAGGLSGAAASITLGYGSSTPVRIMRIRKNP